MRFPVDLELSAELVDRNTAADLTTTSYRRSTEVRDAPRETTVYGAVGVTAHPRPWARASLTPGFRWNWSDERFNPELSAEVALRLRGRASVR